MVIVMVKASHQEINVSVSNVPKSDGHATVCEYIYVLLFTYRTVDLSVVTH